MKKLALRLAMKLNSAKTEDRPKDVNPVSYPVPIDEGSLQNIVEFMAEDFAVSIAAICLVGKEEASVIAGVGVLKNTSLEKSESFCAWAMQADDIVVINNAVEEPLLRQHPFVKGEQKIVFVAAVPLTTQNGSRIGAVCIADKKERNLSDRERSRLLRFARIVNHDLELILTLQKKIEGLEEREFQLKQASKLAKIGRWEYDVESKKATWSDELFEIYGVDRAECKTNLLSVYLSLIHPDDYTRVRRKIVNAQKAPELSQERLIRPDGKVVYINQFRQNIYDDDGNLVKVIGISQDVTEEVLNSERIKKNEERFSALVQNISDMIAILDPTGTISYVSPSSYTIIGYQPEELIGKNVFTFLHEADVAELVAELGEVAKGTNTGEPTLHRFKAKDGHWVWLESKGSNMIKDMHVGGLVINARNVTERVHLEEQLAIEQQKYQRAITSAVIQAQEAERSEVGRELHDNVNQVLTTVKLYTEMVHDGLAGGRELLEKSAHLLQTCIDEIRSISKRLSAPTLGEISLPDSIKELVESVNLTNRIEVIYKGQEMSRLKIPQDVHLAIYRIIQEQLNNILKYAEASLVTIHLKKSGANLMLEMTDNGKGFDTSAKRSGIGITNMQTRAENLGGHFQISSTMGKGCKLSVRFPLTVDQETLPQEA